MDKSTVTITTLNGAAKILESYAVWRSEQNFEQSNLWVSVETDRAKIPKGRKITRKVPRSPHRSSVRKLQGRSTDIIYHPPHWH